MLTYVSDSSYVLKKIAGIKELIVSLKSHFESPLNSSEIDIEHNLQVQMLSKQFTEEKAKVKLIRYISYQAF